MDCRRCALPLERPGDYCLDCHTANCDAVVVEIEPDRATITILDEEHVLGETVVTTIPEAKDVDRTEKSSAQIRNYAGRIADEIRRKRPDNVFVAGPREVVQALRADLHYPLLRVPEEDPVQNVIDSRGDRTLEVIEKPMREKIGGSHSTLIGNRAGQRAIRTVAAHPHVKKVIPGPIDAGGSSSPTGVRAKVTRADDNGNVRMLIRDGSSVQENRVVTTAMNRELGERVREDLNDALAEADLR